MPSEPSGRIRDDVRVVIVRFGVTPLPWKGSEPTQWKECMDTTATSFSATLSKRPARTRRWLCTLGGAVLACTAFGAGAVGTLTGLDTPITIKAREQPVGKFIRELFGQMGVPVAVDDSVRGAVNGDFDKPAGEVLEDVKKAFQLSFYYDGAVLHVYPASELSRDIVYLSSRAVGKQVVDNVAALDLTDSDNRLELADMGLVVTGTERFLEQVREIADVVESRTAAADVPETFRVFKLKYGWADDVTLVVGGQTVVLPGVASLLRNLVGDDIGALDEGRAAVTGVQRTPKPPTRPKLKGQGLQSVGEAVPVGPDTETAARLARELGVTASGDGRARIVADPLNNAVVIRDRADRMASYGRLIDTLDVEPLMVEIEATIIDINTDRLRQLGIEWRLQSERSDALLGASGVRPATTLGTGTDPVSDDSGGIVSLVLGDRTRFISRIRALEEQGAARIVSKPHVITLANVEALLDSTSTFFVRVEGQEEVDLFDVSVGTTLRVTPHVFESLGGTQIKLLVNIEDGNTSDQRVDQIPIIDRSTINTQALIEEGQSLLIGGLVRETSQNSVSKVPVLGDLPGIGALFRSNAKSARQAERMFLITPRLTARATAAGASAGLRLDAPILSGSESDIVGAGPVRLEAARAGLNERDARYPLKPSLPQGETDVGLATDDPARATPRPRRAAPIRLERRPKSESVEPMSIGGRRSVPGPSTGPSPESLPGPERPATLDVSDGAPPADAGAVEEGWSSVPGSDPTGR